MLSLYIFLLLIVGSVSCYINRCAVCFQSFSEHRLQSTQNAARIKRFKDYTSIKALNKKKHNSFFIMLELNSSMFVQTLATARTTKVRTGWPYM